MLREVGEVLCEVQALLARKNKAYGDSALSPLRVFSSSDEVEGLRVRIDDKLSRIKADTLTAHLPSSQPAEDIVEDTLLDLLGYLVLLRVALKRRKHGQETD